MDIKNNRDNNFAEQQLSSKELYELKKKQKEEARKKEVRKVALNEAPKKIGRYLLYGGIAVAIIGGLGWFISTRPPIPEEEIISRSGIHWHPELAIFVKGQKQEIPANLGLGAVHNPMHTHDSSGVIHLEFQGVVRKDDLKLGHFFEVWGKDFMKLGSSVKMMVNGEENTELENYIMQDKDKIELRFDEQITKDFSATPEVAVREISMVSGNLFFNPKNLTLVKGQPVRITFQNTGTHTFTIDELGVNVALRGSSPVAEFTPTQSGTFQYYCSVPGHRSGGMFGSLSVE